MKQVCFWMKGDTVIHIEETHRIYEVINVEKRKRGVWIQLENVIDKTTYSAYENTLMSQKLIGYRKEHEII